MARSKLPNMMIRRRQRLRRAAPLIAALIIGAGMLLATQWAEIGRIVVAPAPAATPVPAAPAIAPPELAFYEFVAPRLTALIAEANVLEELGRSRSRDLVELQVRSERVSRLIDEIDAYLASVAIPPSLQPAVDRYLVGVAGLSAGMRDARAAVLRFHWDGVATGLDVFAHGEDSVSASLVMLQTLVASGDPVSSLNGNAERMSEA